jgi:tRNA1Val (adenine37-N6)-methyltransferase
MSRNQNREHVFRFKQFEVRNELSAMKVGTDGVLIGSWMPVDADMSVMDIGAGCGLIALMAAQRGASSVTAVEIDASAASEAQANVTASPWSKTVTVINDDFFNVAERFVALGKKFNLIVSNPPFFTNGILPVDESRHLARHCTSLDFPQLIAAAAPLMAIDGHLALISPVNRRSDIEFAIAVSKLHICKQCLVSTKLGASPTRILWDITNTCVAKMEETLIVGSERYKQITAPFYIDK